MCFGGPKVSAPAPPPLPPELPPPPRLADPEVRNAKEKARKQAALARGRAGTVAGTGPLGIEDPITNLPVPKKLLGT